MIKGRVWVRLRDEVLDPQGTTVAQALDNLGYDEVVSVRQGKVFEVELDTDDAAQAEARLEKMAEELLANPVIESFQVSVAADEKGSALAEGTGPMAPDRGGRRAGLDRRRGPDRRGPDRRSGLDRRAPGGGGGAIEDERRTGSDRRRGEDRRSGTDRRSGDSRRGGSDRRRKVEPVAPGEERRKAWGAKGEGEGEEEDAEEGAS